MNAHRAGPIEPLGEGIDPDVDLHRRADLGELRDSHWPVVAAVAAGGAIGALGRHAVILAWPVDAGQFPWSVWWINVTGCAAIGVVLVLVTEVIAAPHRLLRPFIGTGILGGFTTMSTYADQVWDQLRAGRLALALSYALSTLLAALVAVSMAAMATRAACGVTPIAGPRRAV